jgi:hypothetical protein
MPAFDPLTVTDDRFWLDQEYQRASGFGTWSFHKQRYQSEHIQAAAQAS